MQGLEAWVRGRLGEHGDLTLDELWLELEQVHDVTVHRSAVGFTALGSAVKKTLLATEQHRPDVARSRRIWITCRQPFMGKALDRLVFIYETSLNTKMTKTTGSSIMRRSGIGTPQLSSPACARAV